MKRNNRNAGNSTEPVWRLIACSYSKSLTADSQLREPVPFPRKTQQATSAAPPLLGSTGAKTVGLTWGRSDREGVLAPYRLFSTLTSTESDITRRLIIQMLNDYKGKVILNSTISCKRVADNLNVCKRIVNHCLTFGNSWGICKNKFNTKD